jgi:hypothetical protein
MLYVLDLSRVPGICRDAVALVKSLNQQFSSCATGRAKDKQSHPILVFLECLTAEASAAERLGAALADVL